MLKTYLNQTNIFKENSSTASNSIDNIKKVSIFSKFCKHNFKTLEKYFEISTDKLWEKICFCNRCKGLIILLDDKTSLITVSSLSPKKMYDLINPVYLFEELKKNSYRGGLCYINSYNKKRKDMISFLGKLTNKYKLSDDSFFLSIELLDIVCSKVIRFEVDLELLAISCFFLAGK